MATRKSTASTEKKTTTRKAPTKKAAAAASPVEKKVPSFEDIAILAEQYWNERGRPFGSPEVDWHRAEATLYAA